MAELKDIRKFIADLGGAVRIVHERYTWRGLRMFPLGADGVEPVVDYEIGKEGAFAYTALNSKRHQSVTVYKVSKVGDEYELRSISAGAGDEILLLRLQAPTKEDRETAEDWIDSRNLSGAAAALQQRIEDLQRKPYQPHKPGPMRKHQAVMVHAANPETGALVTMAAIGWGKSNIAVRAYPGMDSVGEVWFERLRLAMDNGGKPAAIMEHWLERVNGNTEDLSEPFEVEAEDAEDAAHAALVKFNDAIGMVIEV